MWGYGGWVGAKSHLMPKLSPYPKPPSIDGKINIGFRIPAELNERMKAFAREQKMFLGGVWEEAAEEYLKKNKQVGVSRKA